MFSISPLLGFLSQDLTLQRKLELHNGLKVIRCCLGSPRRVAIGTTGTIPPNSKVSRSIKYLKYKPTILQCKSTKLPQGTYPALAFSRIQTCISPFMMNDRKWKQLE